MQKPEDPIVAEVRRTRENIFATFDYDIRAYVAHIVAIQEEEKKRGVIYSSPPPRRPKGLHPMRREDDSMLVDRLLHKFARHASGTLQRSATTCLRMSNT